MGVTQSKTESDIDTINWNKIKTENISSSIPNFNGLSSDAQNLIASLNIPQITESQTSEFTVNHIMDKISNNLNEDDKTKFNQLLEQVSSQTDVENQISDTSPFISSEMYNYLVKNDQTQKGGGKSNNVGSRKIKSKQGGYLSSSAHTEGEYSNSNTGKSSSESSTTKISDKSSDKSSVESSSETQSSVKQSSVTDQNGMQSTSISVNTEDINMVSDY